MRWQVLGGDVNWIDHGGSWYWRGVHGRYLVIEFTNMEDVCGSDNDGQAPYCVDLSEIDVNSPQRADALKSCGWTDADVADNELMIVGALHSYGAKAPLWQESGANAHRLMRAARAYARTICEDIREYTAAMARPVNKIGSTAAEYAAGDINSAILRGLSDGNPAAELMAKLGMGKPSR